MQTASGIDGVDERTQAHQDGLHSFGRDPHIAVYLRASKPSPLSRVASALTNPWQALPRWGRIGTVALPVGIVFAILVLPLGGAAVSSGRATSPAGSTAARSQIQTGSSPTSYSIIAASDVSFNGRVRTILKVTVQDANASRAQVRAALLDAVLKRPDSDAILALGYWAGDDTESGFTAGQLEWARDGRGWSGTSQTPADGCFSPGAPPSR